jgi:hypothetical protein
MEDKINTYDSIINLNNNFKNTTIEELEKEVYNNVYEAIGDIIDTRINTNRKRYIDALASKVVINVRRYKK